jgi:ubiquinone/menaquinone biosynthesis C-methylase UbiE
MSGSVAEVSSIDNMTAIRSEIRNILSHVQFKTVLEVGVGELTTIGDVYSSFGPDICCYGVDLSLNRLLHGLIEFEKRYEVTPKVAKANALRLPFPDDCFDLVITRHTLEQMPEIFETALDEIIRVSKRNIILFEPSFELGSIPQKLKMLDRDYVRGIPHFLGGREDISFEGEYLMENSANPLNHTACYKIEKLDSIRAAIYKEDIEFVCPITKTPLEFRGDHFKTELGERAYPVVKGVPILEFEHSFVVNAD